MWGHEYVITSLFENAVSWKINEGGRQSEATPHLPSFTATRHVCLGGALARPCTISVDQPRFRWTLNRCTATANAGFPGAQTQRSCSFAPGNPGLDSDPSKVARAGSAGVVMLLDAVKQEKKRNAFLDCQYTSLSLSLSLARSLSLSLARARSLALSRSTTPYPQTLVLTLLLL